MAPATVSALTFTSPHSGASSAPMGAMTGTKPARSSACTGAGSMATDPATRPSAGSVMAPSTSPPSAPHRPTARAPSAARAATSRLLISPARTAVATSREGASVTRRPRTNSARMPSLPIQEVISGPPPWTITTRSPAACRAATSAREVSSAPRVEPPILMRVMGPLVLMRPPVGVGMGRVSYVV